eukprot:30957-Pelagococcus_subviridis.AAC.35
MYTKPRRTRSGDTPLRAQASHEECDRDCHTPSSGRPRAPTRGSRAEERIEEIRRQRRKYRGRRGSDPHRGVLHRFHEAHRGLQREVLSVVLVGVDATCSSRDVGVGHRVQLIIILPLPVVVDPIDGHARDFVLGVVQRADLLREDGDVVADGDVAARQRGRIPRHRRGRRRKRREHRPAVGGVRGGATLPVRDVGGVRVGPPGDHHGLCVEGESGVSSTPQKSVHQLRRDRRDT